MIPKLPSKKFSVDPLGLRAAPKLNREEWLALAPSLTRAARSIAFVTGDWLVYGDCLFGTEGPPNRRPQPALFEAAAAATGLDQATLTAYAYVAARVPYEMRTERLSWEHHRLLARLPQEQIPGWIEACLAEEDAGRPMSLRRLRKSLNLGRIAPDGEVRPEAPDRGIENHIPFVNRLVVWWKRLRTESFLEQATPEQREALKEDLEPIVAIYKQL